MIKEIKKILEGIIKTSKVYEWDTFYDLAYIMNETSKIDDNYMIIYIDYKGYTSPVHIKHNHYIFKIGSMKSRRLLFIEDSLYWYLEDLSTNLVKKGDNETINYIVKYLNESYPDFNFFDLYEI
jgi:hypothetical protein